MNPALAALGIVSLIVGIYFIVRGASNIKKRNALAAKHNDLGNSAKFPAVGMKVTHVNVPMAVYDEYVNTHTNMWIIVGVILLLVSVASISAAK